MGSFILCSPFNERYFWIFSVRSSHTPRRQRPFVLPHDRYTLLLGCCCFSFALFKCRFIIALFLLFNRIKIVTFHLTAHNGIGAVNETEREEVYVNSGIQCATHSQLIAEGKVFILLLSFLSSSSSSTAG